jgi:hypothetical protein
VFFIFIDVKLVQFIKHLSPKDKHDVPISTDINILVLLYEFDVKIASNVSVLDKSE